jgi:hypothetical protein
MNLSGASPGEESYVPWRSEDLRARFVGSTALQNDYVEPGLRLVDVHRKAYSEPRTRREALAARKAQKPADVIDIRATPRNLVVLDPRRVELEH